MSDKLFLSHDILMGVEKSARYIGGEVNSITKDKNSVDIRFAMCFPDVYEIGMSNLGLQILYDMFNKREDTWCERVFSPWPDLAEVLNTKKLPLFVLESQDPVTDFDFLGISLQYEMCYTNVLGILDLSGIPLFSKDRSEKDPIVIGGGPCTYNPEPVADFFDMFYIGEGEVVYPALLDLYKDCKMKGRGREYFLQKASEIPGIYVPAISKKVKRVLETNLDNSPYPLKPVIPHIQATQDRMVLEIQRGCIRGCRFCQAGFVYRPNREKSIDCLKETSLELMKNTGYEEISLSSLSSSDYHKLPEFMEFLIRECGDKMINISLPSLRIDNSSLDIMKKIGDVRKTSITFAPEAGSQRMRNIINKGISHEDIINGARLAYLGGFDKIKLYFMLGLPNETDEDILAIAELAEELAMLYFDTVPKPERKGRVQITVSTSFFIPKPFTPFQWASMETPEIYREKASMLKAAIKNQVHGKCISYQWHSPDETMLEGVFARGGREVSRLILKAYELGCSFDAWSEFFDYDKWLLAFKESGINMSDYTTRKRDVKEILPWDFIDIGVSRKFFEREWDKATRGELTPDCKSGCSGCGCMEFNTGVCNGHKN